MDYVTYDQAGALTGAFSQDLHADHASAYIEVSEDVRRNWVAYHAVQTQVEVGRDENDDPIMADVWVLELAPPVVTPLATLVAAFVLKVDVDVDRIYAQAIGNRTTEYTLAEADAQAYKDAGYTGDVQASVQAWATAKGTTATWAADDILTTATNWRAAQASIRAARLLRKEQARVAADADALAVIEATWAGFVAAIRAALGLA